MEGNHQQDIDIDSLLLQQFSSMATQDREVLISELQKVINNQLNADGCAFFLDMNNWNLQGAVCSYFEFYHQDQPHLLWLPKMAVIEPEELERRSSHVHTLTPGQSFTHTWTLTNTGVEGWPVGCCVRFFSGAQMTNIDRIFLDPLQAGGSTQVTIELTCPLSAGQFNGQWKMSLPNGTYFGELLCVNVRVEGADSLQSCGGGQDLQLGTPTAEMSDQSAAAFLHANLINSAQMSVALPNVSPLSCLAGHAHTLHAPASNTTTYQSMSQDTTTQSALCDTTSASSNQDTDSMEMS